MGTHMERDMRKDLFDHYERLSFSYYDRNNTGQMMSKLVSDLFEISEFAHHGPENLFICSIKIVGSFVFLFLINGKTGRLPGCGGGPDGLVLLQPEQQHAGNLYG